MIDNKDKDTKPAPVKRKSKRVKSSAFLTSIQTDTYKPKDFENVVYVDFVARKRLSA